MRISELAERSGCSVATIKYYLREQLLPPGTLTSATQATYDAHHLDRLRLIRVLRDVGGIPVANIGAVLAAIDDTRRPLADVLATAHHALGPSIEDPTNEHSAARAELVAYVGARGWRVDPSAPGFDALAAALVALREVWGDCGPDVFDEYAECVFELASQELDVIDPSPGPAATVEQIIVGTVVFEQALLALRRLAEEHHSHRRFSGK